MTALNQDLRRALERAVERGRVVGEAAASAAVARLGVGVTPAPAYLTPEERVLRRALRARARQLGDELAAGDVTLLVREVGYEQWHRLLFARFLEVNGLLRHPEFDVAVSLAECEELAGELGEPDGWSVAGRFAAEILPGIFRPADPSVRVRLATDHLVRLEAVVTGLPAEVFTAEDSLGWVYQFWQSQAKAEVNASGRKIGGADLSPVTQLFTENYMVRFLLENSLGAWWAARRPGSPLIGEFEFLRFAEDGSPAAGAFEGWPESVAEVTVMDPCCGSGHFLVAAFGMLWRMRAEEEGLSAAAAQDAVLEENLFGLELDPRCTQIAMFALALEAWKAGGFRSLPVPNVACSGIPAKAPLAEWTALAEGDSRLEGALARLHTLFKDADTLGSLIDPIRATEEAGLESVDWHEIAPLLEKALSAEATDDPAAAVFGDAAAGIARAADLLSAHYTLVATNVPYLLRRKQSALLLARLEQWFPEAAADLATAFLARLRSLTAAQGSGYAIVSPQNWLSQKAYLHLRTKLLTEDRWGLLARLGSGAFSEISGEVVQALLMVAERTHKADFKSNVASIDLVGESNKAEQLVRARFDTADQRQHLLRDDRRFIFGADDVDGDNEAVLLSEIADAYWGSKTGDDPRFRRTFWEIAEWSLWRPLQSSFSQSSYYAGSSDTVAEALLRDASIAPGASLNARAALARPAVIVKLMQDLPAALSTGILFDQNVALLVPKHAADRDLLWHFVASGDLNRQVRRVDAALKVSNRTLLSSRIDIAHWRNVADSAGALPEPLSDDPTQWLFRGWPVGSANPLQVAVARLLGFRWPDQEADALDALADADGIVCLPAVGGERPAADRVWELLAGAYGEQWSPTLLDGLLSDAGGKPGDLAGWLRDAFFKEHCRVFGNRPFVWHVWDGRKDGFSALVNYHRLDRATLEKLTYSTLGWWIDRQRADADSGVTGADLRLAAAVELQRKLALILEGEPPFDIYVRWKSLAEQPLGWEPDLDDGVRLNIRPFVEAGVLRAKFTIHWKKDRGTNPDGTERHNDCHHTITEKRNARGLF
jgi:hypothetical protein